VVDAAGTGVCAGLARCLPPPAAGPGTPGASVEYRVERRPGASGGYRVRRDGAVAASAGTADEAVRWLAGDIDSAIAERSPDALFVHAGVVGWRGRAILVPGRSMTGKSTLVAALVREGALYYSDEYAVFDAEGRVHPYARPPVLRGSPPGEPAEGPAPAGGPPLPVALVVSTAYQAGAAWRPEVVRGARAALPVIDNTVLARAAPARTLRLAAGLASGVVALRGPRPEAGLVAPRLLEAVDALLDGRPPGPGAAAAPLRGGHAVARARALAERGPGGAGAPFEIRPARYVRVDGLLDAASHRRLLEHVLAREADFTASGILPPEGPSRVDPAHRRSRTLFDVEPVWGLLEPRLRPLLAHVRRELGLPWFPVGRIERQLAVHGEGDFFGAHTDNGRDAVAGRRLTCVYYFHARPRGFSGGELRLYDRLDRPGRTEAAPTYTDLEPADNTAVFFPSELYHEVRPVRRGSEGFAGSRFAINVWFWAGPPPPCLASPAPSRPPPA
jgi:hypothetical protein